MADDDAVSTTVAKERIATASLAFPEYPSLVHRFLKLLGNHVGPTTTPQLFLIAFDRACADVRASPAEFGMPQQMINLMQFHLSEITGKLFDTTFKEAVREEMLRQLMERNPETGPDD